MINELNNNSIFPSATGKKKQLPDSIINSKTDIGRIPGLYRNDDIYTIYSGKFSLETFGFWIFLILAWFFVTFFKIFIKLLKVKKLFLDLSFS